MPDLNYGISASAYISGELYQHIHQCAQHHEELKELVWKNPNITTEELFAHCAYICAAYLYYLNGFNIVRIGINDFEPTPGKDWFRPFSASMLIYSENDYRAPRKIHLAKSLRI